MTTVTKCDRCGTHVEYESATIDYIYTETNQYAGSSDLCDDCRSELEMFMEEESGLDVSKRSLLGGDILLKWNNHIAFGSPHIEWEHNGWSPRHGEYSTLTIEAEFYRTDDEETADE